MTAAAGTVPAAALRSHIAEMLGALGTPATDAVTVASSLVDADLRGVDSHGAHLVQLYVKRMRAGEIVPVTEITTRRDDGSTVLLDGGLGFGQLAGLHAIDLGMERAHTHGTATIAVRETTHLGALAHYTERAARAGFFSLAFQNGPTIVPPFGGLQGIFSTNPFSYGVPTVTHPPIVYDIATTAVAGNKVLLAKKRGDASIPEGWANDAEGRPTTDTAAASVDHLQWFGGYKGFGMGLLVEVLGGILADSCYGLTENTRSASHGKARVAKGFVFFVVDPGRFLAEGEFARRVDELIDQIHANPTAAGVDRVMVPGEREHRTKAQRESDGIPLPAEIIAELDAMARELGVTALSDRI
jgi:LDH2 family malate/lactate/ureidoglycolate dehydrogenase